MEHNNISWDSQSGACAITCSESDANNYWCQSLVNLSNLLFPPPPYISVGNGNYDSYTTCCQKQNIKQIRSKVVYSYRRLDLKKLIYYLDIILFSINR